MLVFEGVSRRFGAKKAVDDVNISIPAGRFVGIIGRSGAGKSTLLRLTNRLIDPSEGRILFDGIDVAGLTGRKLRDWRADCAMIFQQFNLIDRLDVLTNVLTGRLNRTSAVRGLLRAWRTEDKFIALSALEQFDIANLAAHRADRLSGGQQQRVAIARALVQEPRIILADEPIASLDPRNARIVMDALRRINQDFGITIICNLHSLDLARSYCDHLIGMADGRVVFNDVPSALTDRVAHAFYGLGADAAMARPEAPDRSDIAPPRLAQAR